MCAGTVGLSLRIERINAASLGNGLAAGYLVTFVVQEPRVDPEHPSLRALLSPAELCVAVLVGEGLSNEQMARRLHRSRRTIELHLLQVSTTCSEAIRNANHEAPQQLTASEHRFEKETFLGPVQLLCPFSLEGAASDAAPAQR